MIKAVIIDDEMHCITALQWLLKRQDVSVQVLATFTNPVEGKAYIEANELDLLFLDVHMPGLTGLELLEGIPDPDFDVIFTTAFDKYALAAFKLNALDYLLKPIEKDDIEAVLKKYQQKSENGVLSKKLAELFAHVSLQSGHKFRLRLPTSTGFELIDPTNIIRMEASGNYTNIVFTDRSALYTKSLGALEQLLPITDFFRTHHSHIVNLTMTQSYHKGKGGELTMCNGDIVPVARNKKDGLMDVL